jgi:hypothetical protein
MNEKHEHRMQARCREQGHQFVIWERARSGDFEVCKWCGVVRCTKTDAELIREGYNDGMRFRNGSMRATLDRKFD